VKADEEVDGSRQVTCNHVTVVQCSFHAVACLFLLQLSLLFKEPTEQQNYTFLSSSPNKIVITVSTETIAIKAVFPRAFPEQVVVHVRLSSAFAVCKEPSSI
jgi:hypothetical protein